MTFQITPEDNVYLSMKRFLLVVIMLSLCGCAHVVSNEVRDKADQELTPPALFKDPDAHRGKIVILGGIIVSSTNMAEGTNIEVLQKPLSYRGRPETSDISHGRFLIFYEGYLDTAIYSKGREVTVAGEAMGKRTRPLGEIDYPYPLIKSKELYLFEPSYGIPIYFGIEIWKSL
jgi:outer membrane lipoprotein